MCRADYYGLNYEINPWMNKAHQPDRAVALNQQDGIIKTLVRLGHELEFIEPDPGCPDMCFTANAGIVRGKRVFLANLPAERQPETPLHKQWFERNGFSTTQTKHRFGGGGDALWVGERIIAGYGPKSRRATDIEVHAELADYFGVEVVSVETTDERFYDLDMAIGVLNPNLIAYCPEVLTLESQQKLKGLEGIELIEVDLEDALGFGCNLISDGEHVIISNRAPGLIKTLRESDFKVLPHAIGQFMLTGGGVRCLGLDQPL